jgi:hypothetical protein
LPAGWPLEPRSCLKCGQMYQARSGMQKYCKSCGNEARRAYNRDYLRRYYRANPEKVKLIRRRAMAKRPEYYRRMRRIYHSRVVESMVRRAIGHYSFGTFRCNCCGESERDFLTIDHANGNGTKERIKVLGTTGGGYRFYRWLIREGYPTGYRVLCMNCNMSKGKHGVCAHKMKARRSAGLAVNASVVSPKPLVRGRSVSAPLGRSA